MLQTHGNRWKRQRLETKMRSDPERTSVGGCWESERRCWGPAAHPAEGAIQTCQPAPSLGRGGRHQPRELGNLGDTSDAIASYGLFGLLPLLALGSGREGEAAFPPLPADGFPGQSLRCCPGRQKQAGVQPGGGGVLASLPNDAEHRPAAAHGERLQITGRLQFLFLSFCFCGFHLFWFVDHEVFSRGVGPFWNAHS